MRDRCSVVIGKKGLSAPTAAAEQNSRPGDANFDIFGVGGDYGMKFWHICNSNTIPNQDVC